jgi:serine phosphatase RsbU (regulator of sigma subunit)
LVLMPVESHVTGDGDRLLRRPRGPGLPGLAAFTLDAGGAVATWPVTAARLFGLPGPAVIGRDVRDVLAAGSAQRELLGQALALAAAGRAGTATLAAADGAEVVVGCESLAGPGSGALVIAQRAAAQPGAGLLSEAVARIGTTLDLPRTGREAVDAAVPGFADAASIFMPERLLAADELGPQRPAQRAVVRRLAARQADQPQALTDQLLPPGEVLVFAGDSPALRAMTTGSPVLLGSPGDGSSGADPSGDDLPGDDLPGGGLPGGDPPGGLARPELTAGFSSFLAVPLAARGTVVGCATFGRRSGRAAFGTADLVAASQLAARTAVCIDNARLYDREHRTALVLQRGLLPGEPDIPDSLEVARRYRPVGASVVGGDWHDIVPLPGGRAALIVGDAMGHGPEAAAVMVQLRTAAHTLADLGLAPEAILLRLDRMAAGMTAASFATCVCAVLDPADGSCVIALAGHLPPVLTLADGRTEVLELPTGLPLGLGGDDATATRISLPPGATLALYTDGLVESRTRSLDDGLAALREALGSVLARPPSAEPVQADPALDAACGLVTHVLRQGGEDDLTLVLARIRR